MRVIRASCGGVYTRGPSLSAMLLITYVPVCFRIGCNGHHSAMYRSTKFQLPWSTTGTFITRQSPHLSQLHVLSADARERAFPPLGRFISTAKVGGDGAESGNATPREKHMQNEAHTLHLASSDTLLHPPSPDPFLTKQKFYKSTVSRHCAWRFASGSTVIMPLGTGGAAATYDFGDAGR